MTSLAAWAFVRRFWPVLAIAVVAGVFVFQARTISNLREDKAQLATQLKAAKEATALSEAMRAQEQEQSSVSYSDLSTRCEQRINTAREASQAIEEITNVEVDVPNTGSARPIVPAGQLRRVIGQD